jgi:hypothetical protein
MERKGERLEEEQLGRGEEGRHRKGNRGKTEVSGGRKGNIGND